MNKISRRNFLKRSAALMAAPAILKYTSAYAANPVIKVGLSARVLARWQVLPKRMSMSLRPSSRLLPVVLRIMAKTIVSKSFPKTASPTLIELHQ